MSPATSTSADDNDASFCMAIKEYSLYISIHLHATSLIKYLVKSTYQHFRICKLKEQ